MPILRINATDAGLTLMDTPVPPRHRLFEMATHPGPAIIMIHGYKYAPGVAGHCPHQKIFGEQAHSWPTALGFNGTCPNEGLGIAFGWNARGSLRQVYARARELGESLATIIALLHRYAPQKQVHIIAHSMGTEIALSALPYLPAGAIDRMVLLTGASFGTQAAAMLRTRAGQTTEVLNITSRENDVFDAVFERILPAPIAKDSAIGNGIAVPNALTMQIDCPQTLVGLHRIGIEIAPSTRRVCHWSAYKRPGIMNLYSQFVRTPAAFPLHRLEAAMPSTQDPRWSRLWAVTRSTAKIPAPALPRALQPVDLPAYMRQRPLLRRQKNEPAH